MTQRKPREEYISIGTDVPLDLHARLVAEARRLKWSSRLLLRELLDKHLPKTPTKSP